MKLFSFLFLFLISTNFTINVEAALTVTESFSSSDPRESGVLIWNSLQGRIQAPLHVNNYDNGGGPVNLDLDPGDGRHGAFSASRYSLFSENGNVSGNVIRINTDTFPFLQFTTFQLDAGWTIRPTGSQPLVIGVLGDMVIDGVIDCSGQAGQDLNAEDGFGNSAVAAGGTGVCGGGNGGNGGTNLTAPTAGGNAGTNTTGGAAGPNGNPTMGQGGGGGGSYTETGLGRDPTQGDDSLGGMGGAPGNIFPDHDFTILAGGSGGGGGSAYNNGDPEDSSGGGGGAGGGVIHIVALGDITVSATGTVTADGGNGGGDGGALRGGGGGGGGGGSIAMYSPGSINFAAAVTAMEGAAGATVAANGGDGGKGGRGRTWITDTNSFAGGVPETPISLLAAYGFVRYKLGNYSSISKAIDLLNTRPQVTGSINTTTLPGASSVTVQVSLGDSPSFTPVVWESPNAVTQSPARYLRFMVTINNQDTGTPASLDEVTFSYEPFRQDEFEFTGACGLVKSSNPPREFIFVSLFFLFLPILFLNLLRIRY